MSIQTLDKSDLDKQYKEVMNEFILKSNSLIRDQCDDHIYNKYYLKNNQLKYDVLVTWLYSQKNLKRNNYLNLVIELLDTNFPKYSVDYSTYRASRFKYNHT